MQSRRRATRAPRRTLTPPKDIPRIRAGDVRLKINSQDQILCCLCLGGFRICQNPTTDLRTRVELVNNSLPAPIVAGRRLQAVVAQVP